MFLKNEDVSAGRLRRKFLVLFGDARGCLCSKNMFLGAPLGIGHPKLLIIERYPNSKNKRSFPWNYSNVFAPWKRMVFVRPFLLKSPGLQGAVKLMRFWAPCGPATLPINFVPSFWTQYLGGQQDAEESDFAQLLSFLRGIYIYSI